MDDKPIYQHDCTNCVFLGNYVDSKQKPVDLYWCGPPLGGVITVIARFGDDGPDYLSGMVFAENGTSDVLVEAKRRAELLNLPTKDQ